MYSFRSIHEVRWVKLATISFISTLLLACSAEKSKDPDDLQGYTAESAITDSTDVAAPAVDTDNTTLVHATDGMAVDEGQTTEPEQTTETEEAVKNFFYFSYDDSASTASHNLAMFGLDNDVLPVSSLGKPYEFLNSESFSHFESEEIPPFTISMGVLKTESESLDGDVTYDYHFGAHVSGPTVTNDERDNVVLTLLIDVSGSMQSQYSQFIIQDENVKSLLSVVKHGLSQLSDTLKAEDVVNLVTFSTSANTVLENWQHGDNLSTLLTAIDTLQTIGSTNLNAGVELAYEVAHRTYDQNKANRVVILTDARANKGEVDVNVISENTVINELEGIQFSGIGIGDDFNHTFLNQLTDAGKGSYFSMVTPQDAQRIFSTGLPSLINVAVEDVVFKLTFPESLTRTLSAAEESSTEQSDIQTTNFSYNTSQFFLESFGAEALLADEEKFVLEVEYINKESGKNEIISISQDLGTLMAKGQLEIMEAMFVRGLALLIKGDVTCAQLEHYQTYAQDLESEKIDAYQKRINTFCDLKAL